MSIFIKNHKKLVVFLIIVLFLIYWFSLRSIVYGKVENIKVIKYIEDGSSEDLINDKLQYDRCVGPSWGVSEEEFENIKEDPENYKMVCFGYKLNNYSLTRNLNDIYARPFFSKEFEKLVIGYDQICDGEYPQSIEKGLTGYGPVKAVLIKCDGKSDEEIMELAKKTSFLVTGVGTGDFGLLDIGYSVNWCSSME